MDPNERHADPLGEAADKAARTTVQIMHLVAMTGDTIHCVNKPGPLGW